MTEGPRRVLVPEVTRKDYSISRDVRPKIEVAYLSTKFILMDREKNIKLNEKKMTVIEFTVQKLQIFEYLIFGVFPEIIL